MKMNKDPFKACIKEGEPDKAQKGCVEYCKRLAGCGRA